MATVTARFSQTCHLQWHRPRHELLDCRGAVISALKRAGGLEGFRAEGGDVTVKLFGGRSVNVSPVGVTAYALDRRDSDPQAALSDALLVAEVLGVEEMGVRFYYQHITAWPAGISASEATGRASSVVAPVGDLHWVDFALLADGVAAEGWSYQVEFGVVSAEETPARIGRWIGRMSGQKSLLDQELFDLGYPSVGTFSDSSWRNDRTQLGPDEIREASHITATEALALSGKLHSWLSPPPGEGPGVGDLTEQETLST